MRKVVVFISFYIHNNGKIERTAVLFNHEFNKNGFL